MGVTTCKGVSYPSIATEMDVLAHESQSTSDEWDVRRETSRSAEAQRCHDDGDGHQQKVDAKVSLSSGRSRHL